MRTGGLNQFGPSLRDRRRAAGLTQEELAEIAGLSVRTVSNLERGAAQPHLKTVARLADALALTGSDRDQFARLNVPSSAGADPISMLPSPHQLPVAATDFTGRTTELRALAEPVERDQHPGPGVIWAVTGTAGVGKTTLAMHWAHQVAGRFPDGQLYVNLRGYDPGQPMPPADALAGFLRALGVAGQSIPADIDERAALFRSLLTGRRLVVVLDNAGSVEQVRPLLPASSTCATVVTSRNALAGLVAREGLRRLDLGLLPLTEAVALLSSLIGERATADAAATRALAELCARLPLALRVAAELAAARPGSPLRDLVAELTDQQRRLDLLDADGDPRAAVRAVFSWSYQHLDTDTARAFRLVGLHPGGDLEVYATAALIGSSLEQARRILGRLARACLVQQTRPDHYGLHDLLRAYAIELATREDGPDECRAALTRLFDHYLRTAVKAMTIYAPAEGHRRPELGLPASPSPPISTLPAARSWLDTERPTLIAVAAHTATHGWPTHSCWLASVLYRYLDSGSHFAEATTLYDLARRAARDTGDLAAEGRALYFLGTVEVRRSRLSQAEAYTWQALVRQRRAGDRTAESSSLLNLGIIELDRGHYQQASEYLQQSLAVARAAAYQSGEAYALTNLGIVAKRRGRYEASAAHLVQGLDLARQIGSYSLEARALTELGIVRTGCGRYHEADECLRQGLAVSRVSGDRTAECTTLTYLGDLCLRRGQYQQARTHQRQSLAVARKIGYTSGAICALNGLGEVLLVTGRRGQAHKYHAAALRLAEQAGYRVEQARALDGLGAACHRADDHRQARQHWEQALTLYADLRNPQADIVRTRLESLTEDALTA